MFMNRKAQYYNDFGVPILVYRFNTVLKKISKGEFKENDSFKFLRKNTHLRKALTLPNNEQRRVPHRLRFTIKL
jgi:hypothetical protein